MSKDGDVNGCAWSQCRLLMWLEKEEERALAARYRNGASRSLNTEDTHEAGRAHAVSAFRGDRLRRW